MRLLNHSITLLYILFLTSCSAPSKHEHESESTTEKVVESGEHDHASEKTEESQEHNHDAENVKQSITAYSNDFEVFAEADPFIINEDAEILAHFSFISNYKPVENGSITATLTVNGKSVSQKLDEPTRKGIYKFKIKPNFSGKGKLIFELNNEKGIFQVIADNITVYDDDHEAIHETEEAIISSSNGISFTKEQSWKIDFATAMIKSEPFGQLIKTSARILSAPSDEFVLSAKSSGIVVITNNSFTEGTNVKEGQNLLMISGSQLAENNSTIRYSEVENKYELTKANYERNKELIKERIISEKEFQQSQNEFENAKIAYETLKQNFNANGQTISSTVTGTIQKVFVTNGQFVEAGQPLLSISKNKKLILYAGVQQKHATLLNAIENVNIKILEQNKTFKLDQLNGKLLSIGNATATNSHLIPVTFQIDYTESFIPGGFAELFINTLSNESCIAVPNSALIEEQGYFAVFVQLTPELFEKREVEVGQTDGLNTKIINGLTDGERIVTRGAILVKLAAVSNSLDPHAGHVH
ncbi:MAG: efflux RND transporter periplasmic adaptor subunit [Bacteroidales bacterium]|nr:MAG: efflux RND transporter periplasmic adaptor subunit [Bacteroidales bacterium]